MGESQEEGEHGRNPGGSLLCNQDEVADRIFHKQLED